MFKLGKDMSKAPQVRALFPVGACLDLTTGSFVPGKDGRYHLNGGWNKMMGIGGRGNTFKSTVAHYGNTTVLCRYTTTGLIIEDTEDSVDQYRVAGWSNWGLMEGIDVLEEDIITVVGADVAGNTFFSDLKAAAKEKVKLCPLMTMPYNTTDEKGNEVPLKVYPPSLVNIDSFSMMPLSVTESIYDKFEVGESGMNVEAMKSASAKSQMISQMPALCQKAGMYFTLIAHMGDEIKMETHAPSTKKLQLLKGNQKFKNVPEKYSFLTNTLWVATKTAPLMAGDKSPEYPRYSHDKSPDIDLQVITLQTMRCKTAPTGYVAELVSSQEDGIDGALTELHNIRSRNKYFGLGTNKVTFRCCIYPDVSMTRTNAREKLKADPKLRRAVNILSELAQMHEFHQGKYADVLCTPEELYEGIKEKGYDWDRLLTETRGYPVPVEQEPTEPLWELSTLDLLHMRLDKYRPKEYDKPTKAKPV